MMSPTSQPAPENAAATSAKFPDTCWTVILALQGDGESKARDKALRSLCQAYWFPLYAFARHRGMQRPDAEDAVQSFFAAIGDADFFSRAEQDKGRLRTFILTAFSRLLASRTRHENAQKRGGSYEHVSLDTDQAEAWLLADPKTSEAGDATLAFERHWAKNIIRTVIENLRKEAALTEKGGARFEVFSRFLSPETCIGYTMRQAAEELGIPTNVCEKSIQRLRQHFRQAVREEVASTLNHPTDASVMEEMVQLQKSLLAEA